MHHEEMLCTDTAREFRRFRRLLYKGDPQYVGTAEFVLDMLLQKSTAFARSCDIRIVSAAQNGERAAQCLYMKAPHTDFAQIAFFDAKADGDEAARSLFAGVKQMAAQNGLHRVVAGLHGHLSYGVGILREATLKNTFDTCYNKTYYDRFFADFPQKRFLSAYRSRVDEVRARLRAAAVNVDGFTVRTADFSRFADECDTMRSLCDATIGQTYLYAPTDHGHFYELLKDMKLLLKKDNLLFLRRDGRDVGFLFWHPDYNGAVPSGKPCSAFSFACAAAVHKKRIDTVKLNAVGVLDAFRGKGTYALLRAFDNAIGDRYAYLETNFVWDGNAKSRLLNRRLIGDVCRKFTVCEDTV